MSRTNTSDGTVMPSSTDAYSLTTDLATYQDDAAIYHVNRVYADLTAANADTLPVQGWHAYMVAEAQFYFYSGTAWVVIPRTIAAGRQATTAVTATADLDAGVTFPSIPVDTVIELSAAVVFDFTGTLPSARTMSIEFETTAGTLTNDNSTTIGVPASTTIATAVSAFQTGSLVLAANTAATVNLHATISAAGPRANVSAWHYVRRQI